MCRSRTPTPSVSVSAIGEVWHRASKKIREDDSTARCDEAEIGWDGVHADFYQLSPDAALRSCSDIVSLASCNVRVDRWAYFSVTLLDECRSMRCTE